MCSCACVYSCAICHAYVCLRVKRGRRHSPGELSAYLYVLLCLLPTTCNWRSDSVWCSPGSKLLICSHFCQPAVSLEKQMNRETKGKDFGQVLECIVYLYKSFHLFHPEWLPVWNRNLYVVVTAISPTPCPFSSLFLCLVLYSTSVFEYVCWSVLLCIVVQIWVTSQSQSIDQNDDVGLSVHPSV